MDVTDPDYTDRLKDVLVTLTDVATTDVTDQVPTQATLNAYVGKTLGDLEDDGYQQTGSYDDDNVTILLYENHLYSLEIALQGGVVGNLDDYSSEQIRALTIGSVTFEGFSLGFLDQ